VLQLLRALATKRGTVEERKSMITRKRGKTDETLRKIDRHSGEGRHVERFRGRQGSQRSKETFVPDLSSPRFSSVAALLIECPDKTN
jgi:hypothetical protein